MSRDSWVSDIETGAVEDIHDFALCLHGANGPEAEHNARGQLVYVCGLLAEGYDDWEIALETACSLLVIRAIREKKIGAEISAAYDYPIRMSPLQKIARAEVWLDECSNSETVKYLGELSDLPYVKLIQLRTDMYPGYYEEQ